MVLATTVAVFAGREVSPVWSLILAAALIVFIWPQSFLEVSFQLTIAATLGIVTLGKTLAKLLQKLPLVGENAAVATSAYLFTVPIIIFYFGQTSIISPLANILVAELVAPIMILGFVISLASVLFLPLAQLISYFAFVPAFAFVKVVQVFAGMPFGQIKVSAENLFLALFLCIFVLLVTFLLSSHSKILTNHDS